MDTSRKRFRNLNQGVRREPRLGGLPTPYLALLSGKARRLRQRRFDIRRSDLEVVGVQGFEPWTR